MAKEVLNATIVLQALDKGSAIIDRMANNATAKLTALSKKTDKLAEGAFKFARTTAVIGAAAAAPLVYATNEAVKFEDALTSTAKVAGMDFGSKGFKKLGEDAKQTSIYLGMTATETAGLMESLASGGIDAKDLNSVTKTVGEIGVAFQLTGEEAGDYFVKMKNGLGATTAQAKLAADAFNVLDNVSAAKPKQILEFMGSGGAGVARSMKISGQEMGAIGASFISLSISAAEAATTMQRAQKALYAKGNEDILKTYNKAGAGIKGFQAILAQGAKIKGADAQQKYFNKFGEYGNNVRVLAQNLDLVKKTLSAVSDKTKFANSAQGEFANKQKTNAAQIKHFRAELNVLAIDVGTSLFPVMKDLFTAIKPILTGVAEWVRANPKLTGQIAKGIAIFAAANFALSGLATGFGSVMKVVNVGSNVAGFFVKGASGVSKFSLAILRFKDIGVTAITTVGRAASAVFTFLSANPFVLVIAGAVALVAMGYLVYKNWDKIKAFFIRIWPAVGAAVVKGLGFLKKVFLYSNPIGWLLLGMGKILDILPGRFGAAGRKIIKALTDGIKSMIMHPADALKKGVQAMRNLLPFSPAKAGPFRDLHRVKIIETITQNMKPGPMVRAMTAAVTMSAAVLSNPAQAGAGGRGALTPNAAGGGAGGGVVINYAPVVHVTASAPGADIEAAILAALRKHGREVGQIVAAQQRLRERPKFK